MAQFHVLTNLSGSPVTLEDNIDNTCGHKKVGLREVTYVTGWFNISAALGNNLFFIRPSSTMPVSNITVPDGYYNISDLEKVIAAAMPGFSASLNHATGRVVLTLKDAAYQLDVGLTSTIWGFSVSGWRGTGSYTGDTQPGFFNKRNLYLCLDQINTTGSILNGRNSTLLRIIPISGESYGEARTVTFEKPQFRRLRGGSIQELTVRILDDSGSDISAYTQPYSVTLEVINKHL